MKSKFPAQRVLAATFIPGSLWTGVQLPSVFSTQPLLVEPLLLFKLTTSAVKLLRLLSVDPRSMIKAALWGLRER